MIRLTVKTILLLSVIFVTFSSATIQEWAKWDNEGCALYLQHHGTDGEYLVFATTPAQGSRTFTMYLKDVTPARFALIYNTLKDFINNDEKASLRIYFDDAAPNTIVGVGLAGKSGI